MYVFWGDVYYQDAIVGNTQLNWQTNPPFFEEKPINSYHNQSKSLFDIVNLLPWGEKAIQKNGGKEFLS